MRNSGRVAILLAVVMGASIIVEAMRPTAAMPPFAQSYGINCEVCHTAVPALNAYGRYVQRTGYSSLDAGTIHRANPIWFSQIGFYDTGDGTPHHNIQAGNTAIHAAGYLGDDFTFHVQQWIWQNNGPGGTDTLWITYNNLLHRDGHIFLGKVESPGPSPFSQFFDLSGFAAPEMTVGEHTYQNDGNRWGSKLVYVKRTFEAEAAYLGNNGDLNTATDFSDDTDKTFQYKIALARPDTPFEVGVVGNSGALLVSDGQTDHYNSEMLYAQLDPQHNVPGVLAMYQQGHDSHPGAMLSAANSSGYAAELYEPFFGGRVLLAGRNELTNDGLGTISHDDAINAEWIVFRDVKDAQAQGLLLNGQASMSPGSSPTWQMQLWWATSVGRLH
jgi:hypothetical protein